MKAICRFRSLALAAVLGLILCAGAMAQDAGADDQENAVLAELKAIRNEIKGLRGEIKQVQTEVRAIKAGQAKAPRAKKPPRKKDTTVYDIDITGAAIRGPEDAKVTIVEFVDFQCPYCVREAPVVKQVMDAYPNDVRWVFKHFPLGFHKKAKPAHAAAALALKNKGNDGFWQMHDLILANAKKLDISDLRAHAETVGMDLAEFDAVMADSDKIDALLKADMDGAKKYGVRGTPTVFVNGVKLTPRGLDNYKARVDEILSGKGKPAVKAAGNPNVKLKAVPKAEVPPKAGQ